MSILIIYYYITNKIYYYKIYYYKIYYYKNFIENEKFHYYNKIFIEIKILFIYFWTYYILMKFVKNYALITICIYCIFYINRLSFSFYYIILYIIILLQYIVLHYIIGIIE